MELPSSLPITPFALIGRCLQKIHRDSAEGSSSNSNLAHANMVSSSTQHVDGPPKETASTPWTTPESLEWTTSSPTAGTYDPSRMAYIWGLSSNEGISGEAADIMCSSWWTSTSKSYSSCWNRWVSWCESRKIDPVSASVADLVQFLTTLYKEGKQYCIINSFRSLISVPHCHIEGMPIGKHPLVIRFMQGIFNSRPTMPRYSSVWDIEVVLSHRNMPSSSQLHIQKLL